MDGLLKMQKRAKDVNGLNAIRRTDANLLDSLITCEQGVEVFNLGQ